MKIMNNTKKLGLTSGSHLRAADINDARPLGKYSLLINGGAVLVDDALGRVAKCSNHHSKPALRAKQTMWGRVPPCTILEGRQVDAWLPS